MIGYALVTLFVITGMVMTAIFYIRRRRLMRRIVAAAAPVVLAPHECWPEVLHWQKDDKFDCCGSRDVDEPAPELIALTPDGYAYCWANCLRDNKVKIPVRYLVGLNETLRTREIDQEIHRESDDYMALIDQFNTSFKELQERDKRNGIAA